MIREILKKIDEAITESFYLDKISNELYRLVRKVEGYKQGEDDVYVDGYSNELELSKSGKTETMQVEVLSSRGSIATGQETSIVLIMELKNEKFKGKISVQKMPSGKYLSKEYKVSLDDIKSRKKFVKIVEKVVQDYTKKASEEAMADIGFNFWHTLDIMTGKENYQKYVPAKPKYTRPGQDAFPNTGAYFHNI